MYSFNFYFICLSVLPADACVTCAGLVSWRAEEGIRSLDPELQAVVSRHEDAGNWTSAT